MQHDQENQQQLLLNTGRTACHEQQAVQQHHDGWQQQQQQQQQEEPKSGILWTPQRLYASSAPSHYCSSTADYQAFHHHQQQQQQPWADPEGALMEWRLQQQPEWLVGSPSYPVKSQPQISGACPLEYFQQQQQLLQDERHMQLMATLQQQEKRILHREQQLQATETASGCSVYRVSGAAGANAVLYATPESHLEQQRRNLHYSQHQQQQCQSLPVTSNLTAVAPQGPDYGLPGYSPVCAETLQQQPHVISGHRPISARAGFAPSNLIVGGKSRTWSVTRAVVVGCTYIRHKNYSLRGPANDAHLFAHALVQLLRVNPDDVLLMSDALPDTPYRGSSNSSSGRVPRAPRAPATKQASSSSSSSKGHPKGLVLYPTVDISKLEEPQPNSCPPTQPTKQNILIALNWLVRDALPGDRLFFFFSGHSTQVDNLSAYEGEGYDEALLPVDFDSLGSEDDANLLLATHVKEVLLSVSPQVHVTMILDTCGGQTMLDPAGTGSVWSFIKGVKQKGLWPLLTDATDRMQRANYNSQVWLDPNMQAQRVRPKYLPCVEISSSKAVRCPVLCASRPLSGNSKAYLFAAAPWSQVAVEAALPSIELPVRLSQDGPTAFSPCMTASEGGKPVVHAVFTWCLVSALLDLFGPANASGGRRVSYEGILERVRTKVRDLKWNRLFALDQMPELTIHTGGNASFEDTFYSMGWPSAFSAPSSPSCVNSSNSANLQQTLTAAATATQRLSAACCPSGYAGMVPPAASAVDCVEGYSFFDPEKAWRALTCDSINATRRGRSTSANSLYMSSTLPNAPVLGTYMQQQPLHHTQPYSAAECYRLLQDRQASADSVASYETFAPKRPHSARPNASPATFTGAASQGQETPAAHVVSDCGDSSNSGDSPLPAGEMRGARGHGVGFVFPPGSTLLLPPTKGMQHGEVPASTGARAAPTAEASQKTHCVSVAAATTAAREAYIAAAAKRISEKAKVEAAFGAATNAAHQAQLKKLQDVAPQAADLARVVMQQQLAAQLQGGRQAAALQPEPQKLSFGSSNKSKKVPIYDAAPVPIYEATPD